MVTLDTVYTIQRYVCLSTDTKPTGNVPNGSRCLEMDTGKTFLYDEAGEVWQEVSYTW